MAVGMGMNPFTNARPGLAPRLAPRPSPAPLPAEWSFHAQAIVGGQPYGPIPVHGFSCTRRLSGFGDGQLTMPNAPGGLDQDRLLRLWSWKVWCLYAGQPMFAGVPTGVSDDGGDYTTMTLTEITNYLSKRVYDIAGGHRYDQVEQTVIAADLAAPVADVGVRVVTSPGPGFARDRLYEYLEGEHRAALLSNLAGVIDGPEFRSEYGMTGAGYPECVLKIAYPRAGGPSGLGVSVAGTATGYRTAWDSDRLRTRTFAVGELPENAPEGTPRPVAVEDRPQPDLPRLDAADDWPSTFLLSTLQERANTAAVQYATAALDVQATAMVSDPPVTGYNVGDDVAVRIVTPLLAGGIEVPGRLTEVTLSAGEGTATWTVALTMPPPKPRETLTTRLDRMDTTIAGIYRRRLQPH